MAKAGGALLRLAALAVVLYLGARSGAAFCSAAAGQLRGHAAAAPKLVANRQVKLSESATLPTATAQEGTLAAPAAFSRATLVPSLLMTAKVAVSMYGAVSRRAQTAPVSEFKAPSGARNFQEMALGFTTDIAKNNLTESFYRPWVPYITTIFLFIFGCNWSGALVPWKLLEIPEGELAAPTNNINTTVALSLLTSIAYFGGGLAKKGLGYFARYVKPTPILLPINILEDFTKPLSLSFRLFGNVLADELTVAVLTFLVPFIIPLPIMALGLFAGSIQALIFSTLAAAYIFEALE
mmetsp:Transcript_34021/g.62258  ORF Transcript_34021/g.62258 Transcript_34021/m.62258 type:complete len:295 (-) Transcript_34021:63-947(-)